MCAYEPLVVQLSHLLEMEPRHPAKNATRLLAAGLPGPDAVHLAQHGLRCCLGALCDDHALNKFILIMVWIGEPARRSIPNETGSTRNEPDKTEAD